MHVSRTMIPISTLLKQFSPNNFKSFPQWRYHMKKWFSVAAIVVLCLALVIGVACGGGAETTGSRFGHWSTEADLPVFVYDADQSAIPEAEWDPILAPKTRRHWVAIGNQRIQAMVANDSTVALWDEYDGLRWITAPDPEGTGISIVEESDGSCWGSAFALRPPETVPIRVFGPTWFRVETEHNGLRLERTVLCPEGEAPWLLVRVHLQAPTDAGRTVRHVEEWALRPRFVNIGGNDETRRAVAAESVRYSVDAQDCTLRASEERTDAAAKYAKQSFPAVFGEPHIIILEALGGTEVQAEANGEPHPVLRLVSEVKLGPGESTDLWFRFGLDDSLVVDDPEAMFQSSLASLSDRLPRASAEAAPMAEREIPWHAALLTGGAATDGVLGGHTLNQGSAYSFVMGFNGAARDPLQHALPLVYFEPELALSVLRNTCSWATPEGELPYALDGAKQPWTAGYEPSDQNLWALWLAAEYAAATGDLATFDEPLAYHPAYGVDPVPLREHLRRQFRFFVDEIGLGEHGHVRMLTSDWSDAAVSTAVEELGIDRSLMIEKGESVLNSAMAAWVLPVYAGLCDRLGEDSQADEARALAESLRQAVAGEWNGRWFRRAYAPGWGAIGDDECWLFVQPWAILCGAANADQARALLETIDQGARAESPLGARVRFPLPEDIRKPGELTPGGGIWFSINMTLIWAAARVDPELAWDEWLRMTLTAHQEAYPNIWEGTLSGPDSYNAPESPRAGRTWEAAPFFAMQSFPVNNLHSHAQLLLAYLRLLGVEPTEEGSLRVGSGAEFSSSTFTLRADGSGHLLAAGPVVVETEHGLVRGGPGEVTW